MTFSLTTTTEYTKDKLNVCCWTPSGIDGTLSYPRLITLVTKSTPHNVFPSWCPALFFSESLTDDYVCTFTKLDYASVKKILRIKSDQEEISDFTFSFNQSDICLAAVQWIKADLVDRIGYLTDLSECFCLHQISGSAKSALASLTKEGGHPSLSFEVIKFSRDKVTLRIAIIDFLPLGLLWAVCPEKKITGLVINHGWSPNVLNTLTSDHIFHYFTIPRSMSNSHSGYEANRFCYSKDSSVCISDPSMLSFFMTLAPLESSQQGKSISFAPTTVPNWNLLTLGSCSLWTVVQSVGQWLIPFPLDSTVAKSITVPWCDSALRPSRSVFVSSAPLRSAVMAEKCLLSSVTLATTKKISTTPTVASFKTSSVPRAETTAISLDSWRLCSRASSTYLVASTSSQATTLVSSIAHTICKTSDLFRVTPTTTSLDIRISKPVLASSKTPRFPMSNVWWEESIVARIVGQFSLTWKYLGPEV